MAIYEYISGRLAELTPAIAVVDQGGIGYLIQISLQTYATLRGKEQVILLTEEVIREDSHTIFGFASGVSAVSTYFCSLLQTAETK